jgi:predicted methyltransferase
MNAYHEFKDYQTMLRHILAALKPGGRLILIDNVPRSSDVSREAQVGRHDIAAGIAIPEVEAAGFALERREDRFPALGSDSQMWLGVFRRSKE